MKIQNHEDINIKLCQHLNLVWAEPLFWSANFPKILLSHSQTLISVNNFDPKSCLFSVQTEDVGWENISLLPILFTFV